MPDAAQTVHASIATLLKRRDAEDLVVTDESRIADDLDLDSLELAELSAMLEDDLGRDPYTEGVVPATVGELVAFYG